MEYRKREHKVTPRLIIHGGAGNILPSNTPPSKHKQYHDSLLTILAEAHRFLTSPSSFPLATASYSSALDAATYAVSLLENNPLFNSGHGAVFTRDGINELEASIMVSRGKKKRGVGVMGLRHVKNPIKLAREMLLHGEVDIEGGMAGIGAQGHSQLHQASAEELAKRWGLEIVDSSYFYTQNRWDEHVKGLEIEKNGGNASWHEEYFFSQGTCGAVALDADGVICCATSTGGITNKLRGRIGDTPSLGAGFWAEEWEEESFSKAETLLTRPGPPLIINEALRGLMADCFPSMSTYFPLSSIDLDYYEGDKMLRSTGMSGTGNGDSFLRTDAVRTASAIARYRGTKSSKKTSLQEAITEVSGRGGELEKSAGDRFHKTGEGQGGIIGIELTLVVDKVGNTKSAVSHVVDDYNCGGLIRAAVDKHGKAVMRAWRPGQYPDLEKYEGEGKEYDLCEWFSE